MRNFIFLRKLIFVFYLFFSLICNAQKYSLKIIFIDSLNENITHFKKDFSSVKLFKDSIAVRRSLNDLLYDLKENGFLAASVDSVLKDSITMSAYVFCGDKYLWGVLKKGNVPEDYLQGTGFRKKLFYQKPLKAEQISSVTSRILSNCENNGYPFATVKLDSISITDHQFSAALSLERNKFIKVDSIIIKGTATVVPVYLYNYIGIRPGDVYRELQIRKISSRMKELPFIHEVKQSQVLFTNNETKLYLFLENKKASQFDGVVGLLPDESKTGKFNLTGEVHLKLQNSLHRGEIIEFNWKQLPAQSQDLKVHLLYPFILNSPFGVDGNLAIFKKDSTYIDVTKNLGVQYSFTGNNYLKAFVTDKESDLQSTKGLENISVLPEYADITTLSYGTTIHYEKLDYRLNPRSGFSAEATASTGNRSIRKNSDINPLAYENVRLRTVTYQGELTADYYYSPGGRNVFNPGIISAYIYNPELFVNELYRIGGLKSLRGFDEESIYASQYLIGKFEYRYLLEQNSFLFTFFNMAWYKNHSRNNYVNDIPFGFGAGIDFETKIGIMSVSYALGKQFGNPVLFKNGKIHFGIVNYF
jgi:hypothetical protein